jgi:hypothetical protein
MLHHFKESAAFFGDQIGCSFSQRRQWSVMDSRPGPPDCAVGTQSCEPNQTAWEPHGVTIFATESPRIRRLGANRWRIKTGLIAKSDVGFLCGILWQGFAICNLRTRRALARQNRTESSNLSSSATQSQLQKKSALLPRKYATIARISRLCLDKPDCRERTSRRRKAQRPTFSPEGTHAVRFQGRHKANAMRS